MKVIFRAVRGVGGVAVKVQPTIRQELVHLFGIPVEHMRGSNPGLLGVDLDLPRRPERGAAVNGRVAERTHGLPQQLVLLDPFVPGL
jgi:hypothetical protein